MKADDVNPYTIPDVVFHNGGYLDIYCFGRGGGGRMCRAGPSFKVVYCTYWIENCSSVRFLIRLVISEERNLGEGNFHWGVFLVGRDMQKQRSSVSPESILQSFEPELVRILLL